MTPQAAKAKPPMKRRRCRDEEARATKRRRQPKRGGDSSGQGAASSSRVQAERQAPMPITPKVAKAAIKIVRAAKLTPSAPSRDDALSQHSAIRVASDCSGLGTESLALNMLNIGHKIVFASEKDPDTRKLWLSLHRKADYAFYEDCENRGCPPSVDLYIAGPPCQPWSAMGQRKGLEDGRGIVFFSVLSYIETRRPRAVIIENVKGLLDQHPCQMWDIIQLLKAQSYEVTWDVLSPLDHGIPQSRPRVYIVAILKTSLVNGFAFPKKLHARAPLQKFLDNSPINHSHPEGTMTITQAKAYTTLLTAAMEKKGIDLKLHTAILDLNASAKFSGMPKPGVCPCLTATRCSQQGYFLTDQQRFVKLEEMARLQGYTKLHIRLLMTAKVPMPTVGKAIGNAMCIPILLRLLPRVLWAAGLLPERRGDPVKRLTTSSYNNMKEMPEDIYAVIGLAS